MAPASRQVRFRLGLGWWWRRVEGARGVGLVRAVLKMGQAG